MTTNLEHFRKERGITKTELARQLGVSRPLVSQIALGIHKPYPKLLKKAAEILGVPYSALEADLRRDKDEQS